MEITKYLRPFDKVLVRDDDNEPWKIELFERYSNRNDGYPYVCMKTIWRQCIPFEGNEHLLTEPTDEFKWGEHVEVSDNGHVWYKALFIYKNIDNTHSYRALAERFPNAECWKYCRKSDW